MRSQIPTLLSLAEWCDILGVNPWYAAQYEGDFGNGPSSCSGVMYEQNWQKRQHLSRHEIARAIHEAEEAFAKHVGYYPAPKYIVDEELEYPQARVPSGTSLPYPMYDIYDQPRSLHTKYKYIQALGTEVLEALELGAPVALESSVASDANGRFAVEVLNVPDDLEASEVAVFYAAADRVGNRLDTWEIRPLDITISGTTLTIEGDAFLLAPPTKTLARKPVALAITETSNFVIDVDVYRRTTDDALNTVLYFKKIKTPATEDTTSTLLNAVQGKIAPLRPNSCREGTDPYSVTLSYLAGYPRQADGRMDYDHAQIIAWLSAAYLQCTICGCGCGEDKEMLSKFTEIEHFGDTPIVTKDQIENPFGVQRGAIKAWNRAMTLREALLKV